MSKENPDRLDVLRLRQTVNDLEQRREIIAKSLHELNTARCICALPAAMGNESAKAELDRLWADERDLTNNIRNVELALTEARKQLTDAELVSANSEAESELAAAIRLRDLLLVESAKIDEAATGMVAFLKRRAELRNQLIKTGAFPPKYVNHLISKGVLHRALHKAGLSDFCDLPRDNAHRLSLYEQDASTLTAICKPSPRQDESLDAA